MWNIETPIANVSVAYDDTMTNSMFILIFNQILYVKDLDHNLISLFQLRVNSVTVKETPLMILSELQSLHTIPPTSHCIVLNN
jgi:hypothetical protein